MKKYIVSFSLLTPFFLLANYLTIVFLFCLTHNLEGTIVYTTLISNVIQIIISITIVGRKRIVVTFVDN